MHAAAPFVIFSNQFSSNCAQINLFLFIYFERIYNGFFWKIFRKLLHLRLALTQFLLRPRWGNMAGVRHEKPPKYPLRFGWKSNSCVQSCRKRLENYVWSRLLTVFPICVRNISRFLWRNPTPGLCSVMIQISLITCKPALLSIKCTPTPPPPVKPQELLNRYI